VCYLFLPLKFLGDGVLVLGHLVEGLLQGLELLLGVLLELAQLLQRCLQHTTAHVRGNEQREKGLHRGKDTRTKRAVDSALNGKAAWASGLEGVLVVVGVDGTAAGVVETEGVDGVDGVEVVVVVGRGAGAARVGAGRTGSSLLSASAFSPFSSTASASASASAGAEKVREGEAAVEVGEGGVEETGVGAGEEAAGSPRGEDGAEGAGDGALDEAGLLTGSEPTAAGLAATFFSSIYTTVPTDDTLMREAERRGSGWGEQAYHFVFCDEETVVHGALEVPHAFNGAVVVAILIGSGGMRERSGCEICGGGDFSNVGSEMWGREAVLGTSS
jgi:hypothetical protein